MVTGGTFANAQCFLEYPAVHRGHRVLGRQSRASSSQINDRISGDVQANYTKSDFHRESPTVLVITPASSGVTVNYTNDGDAFPTITTNVDLNNPANFVLGRRPREHPGRAPRDRDQGRARQPAPGATTSFNVRVGGAYDDIERAHPALDNSQAWQNAVCGNNPSVFAARPEHASRPAAASTSPARRQPAYPDLSGATAPATPPACRRRSPTAAR